MIKGIDLLGLGHPKWPIKATINAIPAGVAIGCFDSAFSPDVIPNLTKLLETGKYPVVRVQLWWDNDHKLVPLEVVQRRASKFEALAKRFPNVRFYLSFSCEHNEKDLKKLQDRITLIKRLAPSCVPVNTPWKGALIDGCVNETHYDRALNGPYLASTDGRNAFDMNITKWLNTHAGADVVFLWGMRLNLSEALDKGQRPIPPAKRTAMPDVRYMRGILALFDGEGTPPAPEFTGEIIPIVKPFVYKTFAEDKPGEDARANRPLLVSNTKAAKLEIVCKNGKSIGSFAFYGPYNKLWRHYSGYKDGVKLYGYEIANRALLASGSSWIWFKNGRKFYGPVHPSFRRGFF